MWGSGGARTSKNYQEPGACKTYIMCAVWGGTKVIAREPKKKLGFQRKNLNVFVVVTRWLHTFLPISDQFLVYIIRINQSECLPKLSHKRDHQTVFTTFESQYPSVVWLSLTCDTRLMYWWLTFNTSESNLWSTYDQLVTHCGLIVTHLRPTCDLIVTHLWPYCHSLITAYP